jgi:hypothetical protein
VCAAPRHFFFVAAAPLLLFLPEKLCVLRARARTMM